MKKLFLPIIFAGTLFAAEAQVKMPQPSPTQTIKQDFALASVEITYSRPAMKGRKIMGDLVPFNKIWRLGANAATKVRFNDPVIIADKKVDSGTYALYAIPGVSKWEFVLNKGTGNWGTTGYKADDDVARFSVPVKKLTNTVESFTINFANVLPESANIEISWEKTMVAIPIRAEIRERMKRSIEDAIATSEKKPYSQAANYYVDYENDYEKALPYATKAVEANPKAYWLWLSKAKIEKKLGKKAEAKASAEMALKESTDQKNDDYIKMSKELLAELK